MGQAKGRYILIMYTKSTSDRVDIITTKYMSIALLTAKQEYQQYIESSLSVAVMSETSHHDKANQCYRLSNRVPVNSKQGLISNFDLDNVHYRSLHSGFEDVKGTGVECASFDAPFIGTKVEAATTKTKPKPHRKTSRLTREQSTCAARLT